MESSGFDIGGWSDNFFFVYTEWVGDIDLRARVKSISSQYANTGIMIRKTLDPSSIHITAVVERQIGAFTVNRLDEESGTQYSPSFDNQEGSWLRLTKVGSTVETYTSTDGDTWTTMFSQELLLEGSYFIGLASTTSESAAMTQIVVDKVSLAE